MSSLLDKCWTLFNRSMEPPKSTSQIRAWIKVRARLRLSKSGNNIYICEKNLRNAVFIFSALPNVWWACSGWWYGVCSAGLNSTTDSSTVIGKSIRAVQHNYQVLYWNDVRNKVVRYRNRLQRYKDKLIKYYKSSYQIIVCVGKLEFDRKKYTGYWYVNMKNCVNAVR